MASTSLVGAARRATSGPVRLHLLPWLAPVGILALWKLQPGMWWSVLDKAIPATLALAVVLLAARNPGRCLVALFALMPYQVFAPAWLYANGVPVGIIRPLTAWREAIGLAIVLAAVRAARREQRRLARLDILGFAYVIVVAAYALFPRLFADAAPLDSDIRSLGFRSSASFVLLLLACRHAPLDRSGRDLADRALRWTAVVVAGLALWEFVDGDSWNRFAVETVEVTRYQLAVLDSPVFDPTDVRVVVEIGGREFVRVSSVMGSPLSLSHFLLVPFALALERALRGRTRGATIQASLIGAALLFTQTRSALLGAVVIIAAVVRRSPGRSEAARSRFWLILVGVIVAAAPFIVSAGLFDRFGDDDSNDAHQEGFADGIEAIAENPLGDGLGTSAGVGQQFGTVRRTLSENYYLQVGTEVGVIGMASFVALVVAVNGGLRRARDATGDAVVAGARSGFLGLTVAAFFLHAFNNQTVAWSAFGLAGLALGANLGPRAEREPAPSATMVS